MSQRSLVPLQSLLTGIRHEIPLGPDTRLRVFGGRSLTSGQLGYAVDGDGQAIDGWPETWVVIGTDAAGIFIAESASPLARVLHGRPTLVGWTTTRVDAGVERFAERLRCVDRFSRRVWGRRRAPDACQAREALAALTGELKSVGRVARGGYWDHFLATLAEDLGELERLHPAADVIGVHRFVQTELSPTLARLGGFDDVIAGAHAEQRSLVVAGVVRSQAKIEELRKVVDTSGLSNVVWNVRVRPELRAY